MEVNKIMELEKIRQIVAGILNIALESITPESAFIEDLGADSLDIYQIIMGIEDEFDLEISPAQAEQVRTVGEVMELIRNIGKE